MTWAMIGLFVAADDGKTIDAKIKKASGEA